MDIRSPNTAHRILVRLSMPCFTREVQFNHTSNGPMLSTINPTRGKHSFRTSKRASITRPQTPILAQRIIGPAALDRSRPVGRWLSTRDPQQLGYSMGIVGPERVSRNWHTGHRRLRQWPPSGIAILPLYHQTRRSNESHQRVDVFAEGDAV
jgi:hypothetical protein